MPAFMARVLVTTLHRTADWKEAHGYLMEIDWARKVVTQKIQAPPLWSQFGERARGGRRGLRGITFHNGLVWVASCDALVGFTPEGLRPERIISHPYMAHIHEIEGCAEGIWVTSTNGNGVFLINERQEVLKEAWLEGAPSLDLRVHMEKHYDKFHVNTVFLEGAETFMYSSTTGKVYRAWPGPVTEVAQLEPRCHNVVRTKFGWVRNVSGESIVKVGDHELHTPVRGNKKDFTSPGWLRGMAWLDENRILVGTSPATLLEIDLRERKVVDQMQLEEDPGWTTHGIYVDERKCCEGGAEHTPTQVKDEKKPRGLKKILGKLGV
jgi:hypothetical protein